MGYAWELFIFIFSTNLFVRFRTLFLLIRDLRFVSFLLLLLLLFVFNRGLLFWIKLVMALSCISFLRFWLVSSRLFGGIRSFSMKVLLLSLEANSLIVSFCDSDLRVFMLLLLFLVFSRDRLHIGWSISPNSIYFSWLWTDMMPFLSYLKTYLSERSSSRMIFFLLSIMF